MKSEDEILETLNSITNNQVKEVSLIYELGDYFQIERERDKQIKQISKLRASRQKLRKKDDSEKLQKVNSKLKKSLASLIKTVIKMHQFKRQFTHCPEAFYKSRRLFVTFKNFKIAKDFKDLYNLQYKRKGAFLSSISPGAYKRSMEKLDSKKQDKGPQQMHDKSESKLTRNQEKYVDVDTKLKYRGSTIDSNLDDKIAELSTKQNKFDNPNDNTNKSKQFYSERPGNYNEKMRNELKRGFVSKMMQFYTRSQTSEDRLNMLKMLEVFGPGLKLKRSLDPKYINWDYHSDSELGRVEMVLYSVGLLVVMPAICFYLNYQYFKLDLISQIDGLVAPPNVAIYKILWTIGITIWDNVAMSLIAVVFNKSRFLNISNQYKYTYSFYCIYGVFSGLLMPNLAMEKAYEYRTKSLDPEVRRDLAVYLIDGLYSNFHSLIFSAANYKILQPVLVARLRKVARRLPKIIKIFRKKDNKPNAKDLQPVEKTDSGSFDLLSEMKRIKDETKRLQEEQEKENDALIFGLSFMTNCFFNVCYYGLLTPSVFFYILPSYIAFIGFDWVKFRMQDHVLMQKLKDSIKRSFKTIKSITVTRSRAFSSSKKAGTKVIKAQIKQHSVQEVPWTIYVNFVYMLLLGGFPLTLLGYYGLAKRFSKFMTVPLLKSAIQKKSLFFVAYDTMFLYIDKVSLLVFHENAIVMVETFTKSLKEMVSETIHVLFDDKHLFVVFVLYLIVLVLVLNFFRIERYINRIQSRIWKRKKVLETDIVGEGFRDSNPAYKLLA